jgi:2'-5' RNA ligase
MSRWLKIQNWFSCYQSRQIPLFTDRRQMILFGGSESPTGFKCNLERMLWVDTGLSRPPLGSEPGNLLCWLDRPDLARSSNNYLVAKNTDDDMTETAANAHLQSHYNTMWDRAFGAIACGDIECDAHLTAAHDLRRGLTLIARPSQALRARFDAVLDRLSGSEPRQYRHPASDMHVTILSLFTVTENPAPQLLRLDDYRAAVSAALENIEAIEINFSGITISRSAILAQGFPHGPALETLRERLRVQLRARGLHTSLDQRYRLITAHATLFRFVTPLQDAQGFSTLLASTRNEPFGSMHVNEVELVINDWYMSSNSVERVAIIPLRTHSREARA